MTTAWILAAVSSGKQDVSLPEQLKWCREAAKRNDWTVTREWSAVGSAKRGIRPVFDECLDALRALPKGERPRYLVCVRLDRLGRGSGIETIGAVAELKRLGVTIFSREDGEVRVERASEAILPSIRAIVAALENETRADRTRAGQARRRAEGKHLGAVPYGTVLLDGKPVRYEPEAVIVDEVFALLGSGWGLERIAGAVRDKAPPKKLGNGSTRALTWGQSTIRSLYESEVIRAVVVSESALAKAEAARKDNYRYAPTGEWEWPLRGAVRCTCGHRLMGHASGVKGYRVRYYRCRSHPYDERPEGNRRPGHRADALEQSFVDLLKTLSASPDIVFNSQPKRSAERVKAEEQALKRKLAQLEQRRKRACELAEEGGYTAAELRERLDGIDRERRALGSQLEDLTAEARRHSIDRADAVTMAEVLKRLPAAWPTLPIEHRQAIAKALSSMAGGLVARPDAPGLLFINRSGLRRARRGDSGLMAALPRRMFM
jgi:DNA invertase Pin-like site-specific DNA recombinase